MRAQAARVRLSSENIANADTPGYRRKLVSFEQAFAEPGEPVTVKAGPMQLDQSELVQVYDPTNPLADKNGYSLVTNLASHGVGRSLHDEPAEIPTWWEPGDRRRIHEGLVFTIEPFLSLGADWVEEGDDGWTLTPPGHEPTVQYEHTLVATRRGPIILTLAA